MHRPPERDFGPPRQDPNNGGSVFIFFSSCYAMMDHVSCGSSLDRRAVITKRIPLLALTLLMSSVLLMLMALGLLGRPGASAASTAQRELGAVQVGDKPELHWWNSASAPQEADSEAASLCLLHVDQHDPLPATWYLRYTVYVTNCGNTALSDVWVTDTLPSETYFVAADMGGVHDTGIVTWTIPSLGPGYGLELHLTAGTFSTLRGVITNTLSAQAYGLSPVTVSETTMVIAAPPTATPTPVGTLSPTSTVLPTSQPTPGVTATIPRPWPTSVFSSTVDLPPVVFVMLDWMNGDWSNPNYCFSYVDKWGYHQEVCGNPDFGALGGWTEFYWNELNPGRDVYRWDNMDKYIQDAQRMSVTLPSGEVIAKPVGISVATWVMDEDPYGIGTNRTPGWVATECGGTTTSCYDPDGPSGPCKPFCTPRFGDPIWQYWFDQFILAMGRRYDGNPAFHNLAFVSIATGVDAETKERKDAHGCRYDLGNSPAFNEWVLHVMETYNLAFPNTVQFIQSNLHGIHQHAERAASFPSGMTGVKVNGMEVDVPTAEVRLDGVLMGGVTGFSSVWHPYIPTGFEPKHGNGIAGSYWFFMESLSVHPYMFDIQLPNIKDAYWAEQGTGFPVLDFVRAHLGRTVEDTPDVWIVLRETYGREFCWTSSDGVYRCHGPHRGDFEYWLYRSDSAPGSQTRALLGRQLQTELPDLARNQIYGWHSTRRTDQASGNPYMSFDVDDRYPFAGSQPKAAGGDVSWIVSLTFVNHGSDTLSLEYMDYQGRIVSRPLTKGPVLGPVGGWVNHTWRVDDASFDNSMPGQIDFRINCNGDGDEFAHRLIVHATDQ